jgi:hypothetical protein
MAGFRGAYAVGGIYPDSERMMPGPAFRWSIRIIPPLSVMLYIILLIAMLVYGGTPVAGQLFIGKHWTGDERYGKDIFILAQGIVRREDMPCISVRQMHGFIQDWLKK